MRRSLDVNPGAAAAWRKDAISGMDGGGRLVSVSHQSQVMP
jgi:hypothetical protein